MIENWNHYATEIPNDFVREWKRQGKPVVGYTCSYMPDEIFHAAGILPHRLRGFGAKECSIGDTYFGPFICSMPKYILQMVGEKHFRFLDGAIITPGCDSMRRLDECWRRAGEDIGGITPAFFFHFGVPHKFTDYTKRWFKEEMLRLIEAIEKHFSCAITEDALRGSIRVYNESRKLLREFDRLRIGATSPIHGADALAVILAGSALERAAYNEALESLLESLRNKQDDNERRIRLMLVGSAVDDIELLRLIEGDNAQVVADNLCFSARFHLAAVSEEGDPIDALVDHYLSRNECPRMYGQYQARLSMIREKIERAKVNGVVLQNIRFCDMHGAENGLLDRDLEALGIACLRIEREYGLLVEKGRLKIRIDAFLEKISKYPEAQQ